MSANPWTEPDSWIALSVGNSRLHWGLFCHDQLQQICHTPHLNGDTFLPSPPQDGSSWRHIFPFLPPENLCPELWIASVVPHQTALWRHYPRVTILERSDIPLQEMYPTFGLDRAIALWQAGTTYGWPTLMIDGGTALTLTGADAVGRLVGGAILPGLELQRRSLYEQTAGLPLAEQPLAQLPAFWARDTEAAIQSGIVYGAIAGLTLRIEQWRSIYPSTQIVFTGGDANTLVGYLNLGHQALNSPKWLHCLTVDSNLIFRGIAALRSKKRQPP
jgi:type III pantothenate kinase